jgi:hypothetical protein
VKQLCHKHGTLTNLFFISWGSEHAYISAGWLVVEVVGGNTKPKTKLHTQKLESKALSDIIMLDHAHYVTSATTSICVALPYPHPKVAQLS